MILAFQRIRRGIIGGGAMEQGFECGCVAGLPSRHRGRGRTCPTGSTSHRCRSTTATVCACVAGPTGRGRRRGAPGRRCVRSTPETHDPTPPPPQQRSPHPAAATRSNSAGDRPAVALANVSTRSPVVAPAANASPSSGTSSHAFFRDRTRLAFVSDDFAALATSSSGKIDGDSAASSSSRASTSTSRASNRPAPRTDVLELRPARNNITQWCPTDDAAQRHEDPYPASCTRGLTQFRATDLGGFCPGRRDESRREALAAPVRRRRARR